MDKVLALIQESTKPIRLFIDKDEAFDVLDPTESTPDEMIKAYRDLVNYYNKLTTHYKDLDQLRGKLIELRLGVSQNTPNGMNLSKNINEALKYLDCLKDSLENISNKYYYSLRFYEKYS